MVQRPVGDLGGRAGPLPPSRGPSTQTPKSPCRHGGGWEVGARGALSRGCESLASGTLELKACTEGRTGIWRMGGHRGRALMSDLGLGSGQGLQGSSGFHSESLARQQGQQPARSYLRTRAGVGRQRGQVNRPESWGEGGRPQPDHCPGQLPWGGGEASHS